MPNYNQRTLSGDRYTRSKRVVIENPLGGIPSAMFLEQDVLVAGNETILQDLGAVRGVMTDPATPFPLLNPLDDSVVGQATYGDVYALLYSLYRKLAADRDAANSA
jgi:hypothetical protein